MSLCHRFHFLPTFVLPACTVLSAACGASNGPSHLGPTPDSGSSDAGGEADGRVGAGIDAASPYGDDGGNAANDGSKAPLPDADADASPGAMLGRPSKDVVADAVSAALSYYHRNASTGDIWCLPCDGAPVMLAVASYTGDSSADARLLQQMRYLLSNGNDPFGTGGYAANDERNATAMYAIAKLVPRVWSQLSSSETHLIDLIMEATLVASAYSTADKTNAKAAPNTLDGINDANRDYNPNYREGMIGAVIAGTEYFGGQSPTEAMLNAYDHAAFTAELKTAGLANLYFTFSTYQTNSNAPSPQIVQQGITGYSMHGITLGQMLDMYVYLANNTFSATVSCGLNSGAGIAGAGKILSGCSGLPNVGMVGEELEFNSSDANGQRSDASYVHLGERDDLFNQIVVVAYGDWQSTAAATAVLTPLAIGVQDYFYKITQGYEDYSHGVDEGSFKCGSNTDCLLNQAFWTEVLAPAHGL